MNKLFKAHAWLGIALVVAIICSMMIPAGTAFAQTATMSVSPASQQVGPDTNFSVDILIDTGADASQGAQVSLNFDPTLVEVVSVTEGTFYSAAGNTFFEDGIIDNTAGEVTGIAVVLTGAATASGNGTLVTVNMHTLAEVGGTSLITLSDAIVADDQDPAGTLIVTTVGGQVDIPVNASMTVSPASQSVGQGSSFDVTVLIETGTDTAGAQFTLAFDNTLVQCDSIDEGTFYSNAGNTFFQPIIDNVAGTAYASIAGLSGPASPGSGIFAVVHFTALTNNGLSTLDLQNVIVADPSASAVIPLAVFDGSVMVGSADGPDLVITSKSEAPGSMETDVTFTICNQGNQAAGPSTAGIYRNGTLYANVSVGTLTAGACDTITVTALHILDNDVVDVCADINDDVAEISETNNCLQNVYLTTSDAESTTLNGNIESIIEITVPGTISWDLVVGDNCQDGIINVRANGKYSITVEDMDTATAGYMTEYDPTTGTYLTRHLENPMFVDNSDCTGAGPGQALPGPHTFLTDDDCNIIGDAGEDKDVSFRQYVTYGDDVLPGNHYYQITVTFTAIYMDACD